MDQQIRSIDGSLWKKMLLGAACGLEADEQKLNAMNVFPVADGDTGTNMRMTLEGGLARLEGEEQSIGRCMDGFARGVMLSARGNSGVILSQIFAGIRDGLTGHDTVTVEQLAAAFERGVETAYAAVQNPTEGTILTVYRQSVRYARARVDDHSDLEAFLQLLVQEGQNALEETTRQLPALEQAGVVDSGGAGWVSIVTGMATALGDGRSVPTLSRGQASRQIDLDQFTRDSILEFGYCTEVILRLTTAKVDPDDPTLLDVIKVQLVQMGGESLVAYRQGDLIKIHVHTFTPGQVMAMLHQYGEFLTVKVENMSLDHTGYRETQQQAPAEPPKEYAVVAVVAGVGAQAAFRARGADAIVEGGQTNNPSITELLEAFDSCHAEHILVLPNNKNVILAAQQAAKLYEKARVHVIETESVAQGYSTLSVITPGLPSVDALVDSARRAAQSVLAGEVTQAVREAFLPDGESLLGRYLGLSQGQFLALEDTPDQALTVMLHAMKAEDYEIITLFAGEAVSPDRLQAVEAALTEAYPDALVEIVPGGQPVYDYIVGLE